MSAGQDIVCPLCDGRSLTKRASYSEPPEGETRFPFSDNSTYYRELHQCDRCGHFLSVHALDLPALYSGDYVDATYGADGLRAAFERIINLPPGESDNRVRVKRIRDFVLPRLDTAGSKPTLLDVGSGLGVFPHAMKAAGWRCTALDPDPRAVRHAEEVVGVEAVCGDFCEQSHLGRYHLVTFNKVLEHVADPVAMLRNTAGHLKSGGFAYVELPDGEMAVRESPLRQEFFIDHIHVFSAASMTLLARRAGFDVAAFERLREPSGKYTLYAFLSPAPRIRGTTLHP